MGTFNVSSCRTKSKTRCAVLPLFDNLTLVFGHKISSMKLTVRVKSKHFLALSGSGAPIDDVQIFNSVIMNFGNLRGRGKLFKHSVAVEDEVL